MLGLQLWLNLPAADKMRTPAYRDIRAAAVPTLTFNGGVIRVITGILGASSAALGDWPKSSANIPQTIGAARGESVDLLMLDLSLEPGWTLDIPIPLGLTVFIYPFIGELSIENERIRGPRRAVLLGDGDRLRLTAAGTGATRCALFAGRPLREPVAWGGPIVMNTDEELNLAFRELDEGTFIKK
jgi:redox-sensitive bicupin YhaK (pirin superfamily)